MADRMTKKDLIAKIERMNRVTDAAQPFSLSAQNGGYAVRQTLATGGDRMVFSCGHVGARSLADRIDAYLTAVYDMRNA